AHDAEDERRAGQRAADVRDVADAVIVAETLRFLEDLEHDELAEDEHLEEAPEAPLELDRNAHHEEAEHCAGSAERVAVRLDDLAQEVRPETAHEVAHHDRERSLLLLDELSEQVEEDEVAREVSPAGVAEHRGHVLVPRRSVERQVEPLHE